MRLKTEEYLNLELFLSCKHYSISWEFFWTLLVSLVPLPYLSIDIKYPGIFTVTTVLENQWQNLSAEFLSDGLHFGETV